MISRGLLPFSGPLRHFWHLARTPQKKTPGPALLPEFRVQLPGSGAINSNNTPAAPLVSTGGISLHRASAVVVTTATSPRAWAGSSGAQDPGPPGSGHRQALGRGADRVLALRPGGLLAAECSMRAGQGRVVSRCCSGPRQPHTRNSCGCGSRTGAFCLHSGHVGKRPRSFHACHNSPFRFPECVMIIIVGLGILKASLRLQPGPWRSA
jgi:hypothetical protein